MSLSDEHVGPKISIKIKIYILSRAKLLCSLCHEIPCSRRLLKTSRRNEAQWGQRLYKHLFQLLLYKLKSFSQDKYNHVYFKLLTWYFVLKIVLTYCEKENVLVIEKNF